jgi:transcriptional regulator with XRE-family HTH domain
MDSKVVAGPRPGAVLRACRRAAGLTQAELAELARTSQPAVAAYEAGRREPTVPVLDRMIRATGHLLRLHAEPDPALFRLTDLAVAIAEADSDATKLRLVFEFLRGAADNGHPLVLLVAAEPAPTGDARFDALLAAIAEDLCVHAGIAPPAWVHDDDRFLAAPWWVADLPSARARALVHAPASYRRRGVFIDRHDLVAA